MAGSEYVHYVAHLKIQRVTKDVPSGTAYRGTDVPKSDRAVFDVLEFTVKASTPANLALKVKAHMDAEDIADEGVPQ